MQTRVIAHSRLSGNFQRRRFSVFLNPNDKIIHERKHDNVKMHGFLDRLKNIVGGDQSSTSVVGIDGTSSAGLSADSIRMNHAMFQDSAPSWEELQEIVKKQQKELSCEPEDLETGGPSPQALRRTFGIPGEPKIKLYRDHAAWCPYCHKIVLQLEEKRIPYTIEKINMRCYGDKPREFLNKVPSGLLPVLEVDGKIITESALIAQLLETWYPEPALMPPKNTDDAARADKLMRLERQLFSDWLQWLCNGWGGASAQARFEKTMDIVDHELGITEGAYFLHDYSLVDVTFAPFLERIVASIVYYKGLVVRGQGRWPNIERWFDALETRPAYLAFRSDHYTHCHDLPPQLGGCISEPAGKPFEESIDGNDKSSWHLPLSPLSSNSIPEAYSPGEDPPRDRLHAAAKLVENHTAVTRFALRGVGKPGDRPVTAPLSDPTAKPGMEFEAEVDASLRHVAYALLLGNAIDGYNIPIVGEGEGGAMYAAPVVPSLKYLRDRVGVPRDMSFPAARQFRAHLQWFMDSVAE